MSTETINYRFKVRGGTAANLAAVNEIPLHRELVIETDTGKMKLGNGTTTYNALDYVSGGGLPDDFSTDDVQEGEDNLYHTAARAAAAAPIQSLVAGANVSIDVTDPRNPVISAAGGGGGGDAGNLPIIEMNGAYRFGAASPRYYRFTDGPNTNQLEINPLDLVEDAEYVVRNASGAEMAIVTANGASVNVPSGYALLLEPKKTAYVKRVKETSEFDVWGELKRNVAYQYVRFDQGAGTFSWTVPDDVTAIDFLIVGGGGGGRGSASGNAVPEGGASAGGLLQATSYAVTPGATLPVVVGAGGAPIGVNDPTGSAIGGSSSLLGFTALGGSPRFLSSETPSPTGSGWGGRGGASGNAGPGTPTQGYPGGEGQAAPSYSGGGGGGAGGAGAPATYLGGGAGGAGFISNMSGVNLVYAAGGGAGSSNFSGTRPGGAGGSEGVGGKGGNGSTSASADPARNGGDARPNTGSGGGGGGASTSASAPVSAGGRGADGVVLIRYALPIG